VIRPCRRGHLIKALAAAPLWVGWSSAPAVLPVLVTASSTRRRRAGEFAKPCRHLRAKCKALAYGEPGAHGALTWRVV
jgi:hypothetical protein